MSRAYTSCLWSCPSWIWGSPFGHRPVLAYARWTTSEGSSLKLRFRRRNPSCTTFCSWLLSRFRCLVQLLALSYSGAFRFIATFEGHSFKWRTSCGGCTCRNRTIGVSARIASSDDWAAGVFGSPSSASLRTSSPRDKQREAPGPTLDHGRSRQISSVELSRSA